MTGKGGNAPTTARKRGRPAWGSNCKPENADPSRGKTLDVFEAARHPGRTSALWFHALLAPQANNRDARGDAPLHVAADNLGREMISLLLRAGAAANARDLDGRTPLDRLARAAEAALLDGADAGLVRARLAAEELRRRGAETSAVDLARLSDGNPVKPREHAKNRVASYVATPDGGLSPLDNAGRPVSRTTRLGAVEKTGRRPGRPGGGVAPPVPFEKIAEAAASLGYELLSRKSEFLHGLSTRLRWRCLDPSCRFHESGPPRIARQFLKLCPARDCHAMKKPGGSGSGEGI